MDYIHSSFQAGIGASATLRARVAYRPRSVRLFPALALLALTLFSSACASQPPSAAGRTVSIRQTLIDNSGQVRKVTAPDNSYEVQVPVGWRVSEGLEEGTLVMLRGDSQNEGVITLRSFQTGMALSDDSLRQVKDGALEGLKQELHTVNVESQREQKISGKHVLQVQYHSHLRGTAVAGFLVVLSEDTALYSVNAVAPEDQLPALQSAVSLLITSLKGEAASSPAISQVYRPSDNHFSFVIPRDWAFDEAVPTSQLSFHRFVANDGSGSSMMVAELALPMTSVGLTSEGMEAIERGLFLQFQAERPELVETRMTVMGGYPTTVRQWQFRSQGEWMYLNAAIQRSEQGIMAVSAVGPHAWMSLQQSAFDQVLSTFSYGVPRTERPVASRMGIER